MPYASKAQQGYLHAHPEITTKKGRPVAEVFDADIRRKKKGKVSKVKLTDVGLAALEGGQVAIKPRNQEAIRGTRKRARKVQGRIQKMLVTSSDPYFNQAAAQKAFDLVMKMDDDTAEMFTYVVASDLFEQEVEKNLGTLQRILNQHFAERTEMIKKALVRSAMTGDKRAVEYAKALEEITKAPHTPQYYGYTWKESDFRRDPSTGRFSVKVNQTMTKPLGKDDAKRVIGSYGPKDLKDKERARYQDEYRQVAAFLAGVQGMGGGAGNVDVVYHLKDTAGNRFSAVDNSGTPPGKIMDDPDVTLESLEAKPTTLSAGGAAYGLMGGLTGNQVARVNTAAEKLPETAMGWATAGREQEQTSRMFNRLQTTGNYLNQVGAPGSKVQMAGKFAEIVGQYGPEAERVMGPSARKTAYRYRGTEKAPEKTLVRTYGREIQDAKRYGVEPEEADKRLLGFGTKREQMRGDYLPLGTRRPTGAREPRTPAGEAPAVGQMGRTEAALAARAPSWAEQGMGSAIVADYLKAKLPDKHLYRLHLEAGNTPPSEGVIINSKGQLASQAVGYGDDHYVPFNLKNLKDLKGGEYIRNRSVGGLTSEDVYTGLMGGARRVTVVSRSGTFTMEFEEDFRGGRRHNDKARRMTRRYEQLLDAVQSGKVDRQQIPKRWRDAIEQEVKDEYGDVPRSVIREERDARIKEFKENPQIDGRDEDRAEAMIAREEARAGMGEISEKDVKDFRNQVYNELHNMKEVRFRLNGIGYEAALNSLQEQFPYYIKSVKTNPTKDEELLEFELDEGYVEPGRNRPTMARAGLHGTKENPSEKFSASQADYQRGRTGQGGYKKPAEAKQELPKPGAETPAEPTTGDARRVERQKLQDEIAQEEKVRSAKKSALDLRTTIKEAAPHWPEGEPEFMKYEEAMFKDWVAQPGNAEEFHRTIAQQATEWSKPGSGMLDFGDRWVAYQAARGQTRQVKFQAGNAAHFPPVPYSFSHLKEDAYHAGARPAMITAEKKTLDRNDPTMFTTRKNLSQLNDSEMEAEIDETQFLRGHSKSQYNDLLELRAQSNPDAPPVDRMKVVLSSDQKLDQHLEYIHRMRYLNEMEKLAKTPPVKGTTPKKPEQGGGSTSGGATGGLPSAPQTPPPASGGGSLVTAPNIDARTDRMKGARDAVVKLEAQEKDKSLTQAQRTAALKDKQAIARFGQYLKEHPNITDPFEIDEIMDGKLNDNQKQYLAGLY